MGFFFSGVFSGENPIKILSFESARSISLLLSLHASLSTLKPQTLTPPRVAAAQLLSDLDRAAASLSRLSLRLPSPTFPHLYSLLTSPNPNPDSIPVKIKSFPLSNPQKLKKIKSWLLSTAKLHAEMETLAEMEASEKKLQSWKNFSGPIAASGVPDSTHNPPGADVFLKKLDKQRKAVDRLKVESLWSVDVEKVVDIMARVVVSVFARICELFAEFVPELPVVEVDRSGRLRVVQNPMRVVRVHPSSMSGPLERMPVRGANANRTVKFSGPLLRTPPPRKESVGWKAKALEPPLDSVGAAELSLRYADVIALTDKMFQSPEFAGEEEREELYKMLPGNIRVAVKTKLRSIHKGTANQPSDGLTPEGHWRRETQKVLEWLAPMADNTIRWYSEQSCEKQQFEPAPRVLMLHTLQVADRKMVELAIVNVLVGLSFIYQSNSGS